MSHLVKLLLSHPFFILSLSLLFVQEIIDPTGMETFANEPKIAKLLRELKSTLVRCH